MTSKPSILHHLALGARDVEAVAEFYRDIFELAETARHRYDHGELRSIWLDMGGTLLMVEHTEAPNKQVDGVGAGPFLLAFDVAGPTERRELEARLEQRGIEIEERTDFSSYFRDPEGNRVAVSHYPR
ncbi:MAG: VOC family protein [Persicimonas sp.]